MANTILIKGADSRTPITLRPSVAKTVLLLLIALLFVAGGIWMGQTGERIGYLIAAFFALGIPVAIINFIPGASYLSIEHDGLTVCSLFRKGQILWEDVDEFFVVKLKQKGLTVHTMVGLNFSSSYDRTRTARAIVKALAECEGSLPDTYGQKAEELADYLNYRLAQSRASLPKASKVFAE